jgi:hypothetical protein
MIGDFINIIFTVTRLNLILHHHLLLNGQYPVEYAAFKHGSFDLEWLYEAPIP